MKRSSRIERRLKPSGMLIGRPCAQWSKDQHPMPSKNWIKLRNGKDGSESKGGNAALEKADALAGAKVTGVFAAAKNLGLARGAKAKILTRRKNK